MSRIKTFDPISNREIDAKIPLFADLVIKTRNEKGPWEVMDLLIKQWSESNPSRYDSFIINVEQTRDSRATSYGSNKKKTLRMTLDVPEDIIKMFRAIYKPEEFNFDESFYNKFWERYPQFRIAERL